MKNRWFPLLLTVVLLAACGKTPGIDGYGHAGLFSLQKNERGEVVSAEILSGGEIWRYRFCPREEGCAVLGDREFRVAVPNFVLRFRCVERQSARRLFWR